MDEIILNGSTLANIFFNDLMNNISLTDDDDTASQGRLARVSWKLKRNVWLIKLENPEFNGSCNGNGP